jgi:molybdate transport system ATP-binding protein
VLDADVEVDRRDFCVRAELRIRPGERLALFGPSGAGKTTLLEVIAGLVRPRRALITLAGRVLTSTAPPLAAVPPWRRRVGLLRQDPGLFPHLSVRANLGYGPAADRSGAELTQLAGVLGIGNLLAAMPARLSGGQAHRVALGRLLLARCDALLLDEPYAGLDSGLRRVRSHLGSELNGRCRRCWWRTSLPRRRRSPTGWPCSTVAACCRPVPRTKWSGVPPRGGWPSWLATWGSCPSAAQTRHRWPGSIPSGSRRERSRAAGWS